MLGFSLLGWDFAPETIVIGALTGLAYALLGGGLVLVYRATKVVNFAYGEMGGLGAAVLAKLVLDFHWNFFIALVVVLAVGGALGAVIELIVVRRLFRAPRLILLVATIGVAQILFVAQLVLPKVENGGRYPSPLSQSLEIGSLVLRSEHFMVLAFVPAILAVLGWFLTRTPFGIAIRASAENPDRAELVGISTKRVSTLVWVLAGLLATVTAILVNPLRGTIVGLPSQALGPALLLRALAAGLAGDLVSLPRTLVGGVVLGVVEAILFVNVASPGATDGVLFVAVLVLVLVRRKRLGAEDTGAWSLTPKVKAVPPGLDQVWWVRRLSHLGAGAGLAVALVLPLLFTTSSQLFLFSRVLIYAIAALSVTVLIGWAGQLSLGQMAFAGLGAFVTAGLVDRGMPFGFAAAYATVGGVLAAMLIGYPALRVRGSMLAVTTLAFAVAARGWLFTHELLVGDRATVFLPRGTWLGIDFTSQRAYYYLCLVLLVAAVLAVSQLRRSGIGRSIIAVRDNDAAAASFSVAATTAKMTAFALAGALAALAGALLAGLRVQFGPDAFPPEESLRIVAMTVIGGLGSVLGAVLGAVYVIGLPALFSDNASVGLATSGIGLLVLLLYMPGGLAQVVYRGRDLLLSRAQQRMPVTATTTAAAVTSKVPRPVRVGDERPWRDPEVPALAARGICVDFGGLRALDDITVEARRGEIVGLIGSNGAGKSTLMNVVSGFVTPTAGAIELFGVDVTGLAPHHRAAGMGRVFQDARLFGDLTVRDTVKVALEGHERSELVPSLLGLAPARQAEARKASAADDYISFLGLGRYADAFLSDLSTGTRRIVELCCLLAQSPELILLDEPTAGVAQRETEAFGPLIKRIQSELGATVVIIEHDIPLVMDLSDRVYCLAAGRCVAEGLPDAVRHDPKVVAAYLGTDERAIQRSGTPVPGRAPAVDLRALRRTELATMAAAGGVTGARRMRKDDLIAALEGSA